MFLACTPLRAQRRLKLGRLHYKLFSFNGWYAKCCTTYWSVARSATDDDAWMSRRRPPAPPTSMLIPAFTRSPGWCNILHVGSWCSKGRSPSTLSPGGTGGRRTKEKTFTKEQDKCATFCTSTVLDVGDACWPHVSDRSSEWLDASLQMSTSVGQVLTFRGCCEHVV